MIMTARALFVRGSLALALVIVPTWSFAARPTVKSTSTSDSKSTSLSDESEAGPVDLFEAIDAGLIEAKFIPKNEKQARVRIKNLSGKPMSVRLPEAFGARPILAQVGGPFGANNGQSGGAQNLGANFGGPNNQNGMFNVPADKPADLRVTCVCLEYGKSTPRPAIPYEMVRLDAVNKEASMADLLSRLETSNQREVQAAAWHLACGMSWQQLAAVHVEHLVQANEPFFTVLDLKKARDLVRDVTADAKGDGSPPAASASVAASFNAGAP